MSIAKKYGLKVIEDCAQSIGSKFNNIFTGNYGDAGCFSFFPTKNLGCFGDGGMITTNDERIAEEVRVLRGHGSRKTYHYDIIGYNSRLDELQAAVLRVKLPHLASWAEARRKTAAFYISSLHDIPEINLPEETPAAYHVYNQFTIRVSRRDALFSHLKSKQIGAMVYYPLSLHLQKAFSSLGYKKGDLPESELAQDEVISLPIFPELTDREKEEVVDAVRSFFLK